MSWAWHRLPPCLHQPGTQGHSGGSSDCTWRTLQWRHNERDGVSNHQPHDCLLNRLFGRRSNKTSKLRVTGLCVVNSPVTGEFPAQRASNAENVSIWWRHHEMGDNGIYTWAQKLIFCNKTSKFIILILFNFICNLIQISPKLFSWCSNWQ